MSVLEHREEAPKAVCCMVVTVSDTRTKETDKSGQAMKQLLECTGHQVLEWKIVKDEKSQIEQVLYAGVENPQIDAILFNGGTGICKRDVTIETLRRHFEKEMPGFGEIFRFLSYTEDIGSAAILSRATAGVVNGTIIYATPGSTGAVKLALEKLILPELPHSVYELRK